MSKYKWNEEVNKYSMPEITYDNNGNILTLQRNSIVNTTLGNMDNLTYTYKGNHLLGVNDASNNTEGFNDKGFTDVVIPEQENTHEYRYDHNGNMTQDLNKGVEFIKYNYLNKPYYISFNRSNYITYIYDAVGTKLKKTVHYNGTETSTDYVGDFVYHENTLSFAATETGRITPQADGSFRNEYIIADHLGNTRTLFTDANSDRIPEILQENHYDPFGMALGNLSYETPDGNNKYKYNGKELQDDLGLNWYDYGARMYDAAIGRFNTQDRFAEKYNNLSPYQYAANNPILYIDVNGDSINVAEKYRDQFNSALESNFGANAKKFSYNSNGNLLYNGSKKDFKGDAKTVFKGMSKVMGEETTTNVIYEASTQITMTDGTTKTVYASEGGGALTVLASENNVSQNTILIDPNASTSYNVMAVTPAYYMQPIDPANGVRFQSTTVTGDVNNFTFHEIGHVVHQGQSQDKVLNYDNASRRSRLQGYNVTNIRTLTNRRVYIPAPLSPRPPDETHNKTVIKGNYGN